MNDYQDLLMTIEEIKKDIKAVKPYLATNKLAEIIKGLGAPKLEENLIKLEAQLTQYRNRVIAGTLNESEQRVSQNKNIDALVQFAKQVEDEIKRRVEKNGNGSVVSHQKVKIDYLGSIAAVLAVMFLGFGGVFSYYYFFNRVEVNIETHTQKNFFDPKLDLTRNYVWHTIELHNHTVDTVRLEGIKDVEREQGWKYFTPTVPDTFGWRISDNFLTPIDIFYATNESFIEPLDPLFEQRFKQIPKESLVNVNIEVPPGKRSTLDLCFIFNPYQRGTQTMNFKRIIFKGEIILSRGTPTIIDQIYEFNKIENDEEK
jgi:hypothetical protein